MFSFWYSNGTWVSRHRFWGRLLSVLLFLLAWYLLSAVGILNPNIIPGPSRVLTAIVESAGSGQLGIDVTDSLRRVFVGYVVAASLAVLLGIAAAVQPTIGALSRPWVDMMRPIPPIAWIPIALLWFGFGNPSAYFLVGLGAFFPVFTNSYLAMTSVVQGPVDVARCHGASPTLLFREVILPQALPTLFAGLKTGLGVAWMVVITAELVGAQTGLGYMIQVSRAQLQAERVVAGMVLIGIIGYGLGRLMDSIESWLMPWKGRGRELTVGPRP